ncbi:MAG: hypothetical protein KatS3mg021_2847 [Fimbriimonadales bacterium]|nr:MAG: hypothetical protein KatS3mg021_2847 [Fimbriimonadales bacterium]
MHRVLKPDGIAIIVFAHKTTEAWETVLNALLRAGLYPTAALPIHTEMQARLRAQESAALASSIYLVCRKRVGGARRLLGRPQAPDCGGDRAAPAPVLGRGGSGGGSVHQRDRSGAGGVRAVRAVWSGRRGRRWGRRSVADAGAGAGEPLMRWSGYCARSGRRRWSWTRCRSFTCCIGGRMGTRRCRLTRRASWRRAWGWS